MSQHSLLPGPFSGFCTGFHASRARSCKTWLKNDETIPPAWPVRNFILDALRIDIFEKTLEKSTNGFVIAEAAVFDGFTLKCGAMWSSKSKFWLVALSCTASAYCEGAAAGGSCLHAEEYCKVSKNSSCVANKFPIVSNSAKKH